MIGRLKSGLRRLNRWLTPLLLVFLPLALLAAFAWLTRHPEAEILRRAETWPLVGGPAGAFRQHYTGAERRPFAADQQEDASSEGFAPVPEEVMGEVIRAVSHPPVWVPADTLLWESPSRESASQGAISELALLPVAERQGHWYRLRHGEVTAWVDLSALASREGPPLGSDPEPLLPLSGRQADEARLAQARELLGEGGRVGGLGPYRLLTDCPANAPIAPLARLASDLEGVYRRRYGLEPVGRARETVVLFADRRLYDRFRESESRLEGIDGVGHYGHGIVALACTGRRSEEIAATLVHELTHLLNRRALGPALPPWLDEGLAEDLALSRIDDGGELDPAGLSGGILQDERTTVWRGGVSSLLQTEREVLETNEGELDRLLGTDWETFVAPASSRRHYRWSAFLVRFLAAEAPASWRQGFRDYLHGIAAGGSVSAEALVAALDESRAELWRAFALWLEREAESIRQAAEARRTTQPLDLELSRPMSAPGRSARDSSSRQVRSPSL